jgi:peroxin-4
MSKRLLKEAKLNIQGDVTLKPTDNILEWNGTIKGKGLYSGGLFQVAIKLSPDYPFTAPNMRFVTQIFHPNISKDGKICLDVLDGNWSPAFTLLYAMECIQLLMDAPEPDSPLNCDAANLLKQDKVAYESFVKFTLCHNW